MILLSGSKSVELLKGEISFFISAHHDRLGGLPGKFVMESENVFEWITEKGNRKAVLSSIGQPLTAKQVSKKTGILPACCSKVLANLAAKGVMVCLNPKARNSRLYWLTELGSECQKRLRPGLPEREYNLPDVDWELYGWVCYCHREAVIKTMTRPMQPAEIKRIMRVQRANIKISANNIRDIMWLLLTKGIVQKVYVRKKAHPRYELTDSGNQFRQLLMQSEMTF